MTKKILIALGGNALLQKGEKGTDQEQLYHVTETAKQFLKLIEAGYHLTITHGNGPQVGAILLKNEMAAKSLPAMPLDICGAESQGFIGYMIQRCLHNELKRHEIDKEVVSIITQTLVDKKDKAFQNPTKPIGPFYSKEEADLHIKEKGWKLVEQVGKGYRRVVPSPEPIGFVEEKVMKDLVEAGVILIASGGGGIPVFEDENGDVIGLEGVIDKDFSASVMGKVIGAEYLMILTDVEKVAINFGKPNQENLDHLSIEAATKYLEEGQFAKGSMGPKVEAAIRFIKAGGKRAIITSLEKCLDALDGKTGTVIR